jgi:serine/threonine protein kinase
LQKLPLRIDSSILPGTILQSSKFKIIVKNDDTVTKRYFVQPDNIRAAKNEIDILNKIGVHDNIIHLNDAFITPVQDDILQQSMYLYLEFPAIDMDLFDIVTRSNTIPDAHLCIYIQNIMNGLKFLHDIKIAHRDLSLENILVSFDSAGTPERVLLIDFELATSFENEDGTPCKSTGLVGKHPYISPEQFEQCLCSSDYHADKVDIWALGILIFILVVHCPSFLKSCNSDVNYRRYINNRDSSERIINYYNHWNQNITEKGVKILLFTVYILNPEPTERSTIYDIQKKFDCIT